MDWSLTLWTVFVFLRLSLRFVSNVDLWMTLLICKLFSNANEYMCSSLKSLNIATSAVGLRQAVGRVLSRIQISHGQAKERLPFFNGDMHTVVSNYFGCRLLGWKSITAWTVAILSHCYLFFASNRYNHACTYILYCYLPKGAFQEQWLYYIIYNN